ncbi:MAG: succinate--CoA ligase subunit alpha, partial [candidate division Zixibacteria bacterium]|nr:succinate--CoA ligase subunit alpha [candidate division Zixibacteria bacterium]
MAIIVNAESRVMVQGITGETGAYHTERMINYGTNIVGGVTPGKGGQKVHDRPVFDTVMECVEYTRADTTVIFLPAAFVKEAAIEAIRAGVRYVVVIP